MKKLNTNNFRKQVQFQILKPLQYRRLTYFWTTTSSVVRYSESSTKCSFFTMSPKYLVMRLPLNTIKHSKTQSVNKK